MIAFFFIIIYLGPMVLMMIVSAIYMLFYSFAFTFPYRTGHFKCQVLGWFWESLGVQALQTTSALE